MLAPSTLRQASIPRRRQSLAWILTTQSWQVNREQGLVGLKSGVGVIQHYAAGGIVLLGGSHIGWLREGQAAVDAAAKKLTGEPHAVEIAKGGCSLDASSCIALMLMIVVVPQKGTSLAGEDCEEPFPFHDGVVGQQMARSRPGVVGNKKNKPSRAPFNPCTHPPIPDCLSLQSEAKPQSLLPPTTWATISTSFR